MRVLHDPGAALSGVTCAVLNITRAAFRATALWGDGWCRVVWLCAASVS